MKRIVFFTIVILLLITACQRTPENPLVADKNIESLISAAKESQDPYTKEVPIKEKVGAPDRVEYQKADGTLMVVVDANVFIPEVTKIPIFNVKSSIFSQAIVDSYWNVLVDETQMWEWSEQPTKNDIEQMIVFQKQLLAKEDSESIDSIKVFITELEAMYEKAPEKVAVSQIDSTMVEKVIWDPVLGTIDSRYMGISGYSIRSQADLTSEPWIYFSVRNPWAGVEGGIKSDVMPAEIRYEASSLSNNYIGESVIVDDNTVLDSTVKGLIKTTPKEAKEKVEELFKKTNTPMIVSSICLINDANADDGKEAQHYAYEITALRNLDNIPVASQFGNGAYAMYQGYNPKTKEPLYTKPWYYETMTLKLDDDGFMEINWLSPIEIINVEVEDSKLIAFPDILAVLEKMIYVSYQPNITNGFSMKCIISDIKLEMVRVRRQNSDQNSLEGLLIPAWNFYGTCSMYDNNGEQVDGSVLKQSLITINAINGSIIDTNSGY